MNRNLRSNFLWHILFWLAYWLFKVHHEFAWFYPRYENFGIATIFKEAVIAQGTMLPVKMVFAYWLIYFLLRSNQRIIIKIGFFLIALTLAVVFLRLGIVYVTLPLAYKSVPETQAIFSLGATSSATFEILSVGGIAAAIILYRRNVEANQKTQAIQKEKVEAELRFLKAQIHPHFLLNTLNNLYVLARKGSSQTDAIILKLSKLMKFVLYETNRDFIPLKQEVEVIHDYIALEKLRYGDRLDLQLNINDGKENTTEKIRPLILLPLVENAFKHGASESTDNPFVTIDLSIQSGILSFQVKNSTTHSGKSGKDGIGLTNLKKQLLLTYPNHTFKTRSENNVFVADLRLNLNES